MGAMSDLDLMVREGDRTAEDFEARGIDRERAEAMAELASKVDDDGFYTVHMTETSAAYSDETWGFRRLRKLREE